MTRVSGRPVQTLVRAERAEGQLRRVAFAARGLAVYHIGVKTPAAIMSRLTITLSEARYLALKQASARLPKTIGHLNHQTLDIYGIKSRESALELVERARAHSQLDDDQALALTQREVDAVRRKKK